MNASLDSTAKTNLLGLTRTELDAFVIGMGEKPFRARQLLKWLYKRCVADFDQMTDLAKSFRERLKEVAVVSTPSITTVPCGRSEKSSTTPGRKKRSSGASSMLGARHAPLLVVEW